MTQSWGMGRREKHLPHKVTAQLKPKEKVDRMNWEEKVEKSVSGKGMSICFSFRYD